MEQLSMVGFSHRGATLPLLEALSVPRGQRPELLARLREAGCREAAIVATCSRIEIYADTVPGGPPRLLEVFAGRSGRPLDELRAAAEMRTGNAVAEHLFGVTAGLTSRVIGEVEVHGQVRAAFREARDAGTAGPRLGRLFPAALCCSDRVRTETTLGRLGKSLGHRAVDVGLAMLTDVAEPVIMVVGSGRMAASAVEHLTRLGKQPLVAARNEALAARLTEPGLVCPLPELTAGVARADLLICATSAAHHVVTVEHVRASTAARARPLTVVDLSVPRNVDSAIAAVPGVTLIDLEGMTEDASADPALAAALHAGRRIVRAAAEQYAESAAARSAGPLIDALRRRVEEMYRSELAGQDEPERAARGRVGKLMHDATVSARAAIAAHDQDALRSLCERFGVAWSEHAFDAAA